MPEVAGSDDDLQWCAVPFPSRHPETCAAYGMGLTQCHNIVKLHPVRANECGMPEGNRRTLKKDTFLVGHRPAVRTRVERNEWDTP